MLTEHPGFQAILAGYNPETRLPDSGRRSTRDEALRQLQALRTRLSDFEREFEREIAGIGHNNPPEVLDAGGLIRRDFVEAREDIESLEHEARQISPNLDIVKQRSGRLLALGLKVVVWMGERATKFVDAALIAAVPIAVLKGMELVPVIEKAVASVLSAVIG